ncbi:MFS transporter, DHA2 family, multidrug resistance protein [Cupriavidus sp. YR651]|uniref:MFS transporter n=1 Tax=Cupriavidus sp. YR651 TaxID=1855315 RepID=UPI00088E52B6|nr:MFS transporter [Cupriavidus sp. YR651]SDD81654.1 MFS transporter, DHA2 family, multidrug resistance protein [Cupriavidus sp. YR651]
MTTQAAADSQGGIAEPRRRRRAIASVLAGMVLVVLDAAIANIALPTIAASLHVTPAAAVQVVIAYQLGVVMLLLPAAALGESIGYRGVFVAGATVFTAASIVCAASPSLPWLIGARFLQGVGGAGILALGVALLRFSVPSHRLGAAIGWNALTVALSAGAGPTLGATILSFGEWRSIFAVGVPIGVLVLICGRSLPYVRGTGRTVDLTSVVLSASMFAMFVIGAQWLPTDSQQALILIAVATVFAMLLGRRELRRATPLVPVDLLWRPSFRLSIIASILSFTGQAAALVALPFSLQHAFGLSPFATALSLLPWPLAVAMTAPLAGRLADRLPTALLCLTGGILLALGLASAAVSSSGHHTLALCFQVMLCGAGFGLFNVANNRNMFMSAPRERSGAAGGLQSIARVIGQTIGAVFMSMLLACYSVIVATQIGLTIAATLSLAAGITSVFRLRDTSGSFNDSLT